MPLDIVIGTQWGDEGKGRIVDLLAEKADFVARYNGGDNAGHTVTVGTRTFKLHLIPSGVIHPHTTGILGNGMLVNPISFFAEAKTLEEAGISAGPQRLRISHAAHVITPAHRALDLAQESARSGGKIGTTGRGIGPAYTDKAARCGLRMQDMLDLSSFGDKVEAHLAAANHQLQALYAAPAIDIPKVRAEMLEYARRLQEYITDTSLLLHIALRDGKTILAEGAQGTLLDLDHGTYPFVTSSSTTAAGALTGLGIGPACLGRVTGVTKAFQTRVGSGPFPSEVFDDMAVRLRGTGANPWDEFGTTTGRARRVGWLDGVLLRYAVRINGMTELAITKLDILSGLPAIQICTAYKTGNTPYTDLPLGPADLSPFEPVYEELPGWPALENGAMDLPPAARNFIRRLEEICQVPVRMVSVGPEREQIIWLDKHEPGA